MLFFEAQLGHFLLHPRAMNVLPSKIMLRDELLARLSADLQSLERIQKATQDGATHAESKAENSKDTRAIEQSYLARGQANRVEELRHGLAWVQSMELRTFSANDIITLGALVTLQNDDDTETRPVFLAPYGGGGKLAEGRVQVVTPQSPLGRGLLGKSQGDSMEVTLAGVVKELTILVIA